VGNPARNVQPTISGVDSPIHPTRTATIARDEIVLLELPEVLPDRPFRARIVHTAGVSRAYLLGHQLLPVSKDLIEGELVIAQAVEALLPEGLPSRGDRLLDIFVTDLAGVFALGAPGGGSEYRNRIPRVATGRFGDPLQLVSGRRARGESPFDPIRQDRDELLSGVAIEQRVIESLPWEATMRL